MVNTDRGASWKGRRKLPEVEGDAMSREDVVCSHTHHRSACPLHASVTCAACTDEEVSVYKCECSNLLNRRCSSAKQPPSVTSQSINNHQEGSAHECVSQLTGKFSLFLFPSQPLRWIVSDITPSPPHVEINGPALQHAVYSVWNCFYSRSVCCDNSTPIFLLYSNSCQIDKKHLCSPRCCWCCRWEPRVLFLREKERAEEEVDGGMEIGVNMEI